MSRTGNPLALLSTISSIEEETGAAVNYAQMAEALRAQRHTLLARASRLRRQGFIDRANPDAGLNEEAFFVLTAKGRALLSPVPHDSCVAESTVARAIRVRPVLATVWGAA
jgi:Mn-dependent DtxR family transcriptional regulator